jgi:hypothetical protein
LSTERNARIKLFFILIFPIIIFFFSAGASFCVPQLFIISFLVLPLHGIIIVPLYGIRPALVTTEEFFNKTGYTKILFEFYSIKKFLFISISSIIILNIVYIFYPLYTVSSFRGTNLRYNNIHIYLYNPLIIFQGFIGWISFVGFLRIITQLAKREFRFYFAKTDLCVGRCSLSTFYVHDPKCFLRHKNEIRLWNCHMPVLFVRFSVLEKEIWKKIYTLIHFARYFIIVRWKRIQEEIPIILVGKFAWQVSLRLRTPAACNYFASYNRSYCSVWR